MITTKNGIFWLRSQCSICGNKKSRFGFVKELKIKGILSSLGSRIPLSKIPRLNILF